MARTLVLLEDAAQHAAVAAEVATLVDGGEMACRVVVPDEDGWQAIRGVLACAHFNVVVPALSSWPGPGLSRGLARVLGFPVLRIPLPGDRRADSPGAGHPSWS